ncbi:hypothetical protein GB937_009555, partial [Aspergillus fischeri]
VDTGTAIQENIGILTVQSQITGLVSYSVSQSLRKLTAMNNQGPVLRTIAMASSTLAFREYLQPILNLRKGHSTMGRTPRIVLKQIVADSPIKTASSPLLFHPDLHMRNIFVSEGDPSLIGSIIDWQAASIEPAFWYSDEVPDFARENDICAKTFELSSQFLTPKLSRPRLLNENLFQPLRYCYRTWRDGAVALQLGFDGHCLYPVPTSEELANNEVEYKLFKAAQNLRRDLSSLLNTASDGWVPLEIWEATELAHKELFSGMLQAVLDNPDRVTTSP